MIARAQRPSPRPFVPLAILAAVIAVAAGLALPNVAAAQPSTGAPIEGSWSLAFPNEDVTSRQLVSFLPGGIVLATNAPAFADETVAGDLIYSSAGHGAWTALGGGRYSFTLIFLYFDGNEDNWASLTLDGEVTLDASGDAFTGNFTAAVTSAAGMPLFTGESEPLAGARIRPRSSSGA